MRALVVPDNQANSIASLKWLDRPIPEPGPNQVLVQTKAVGLNPVDYKTVEHLDSKLSFPHTIGLDVAGLVVAVGAEVTSWHAGDRVCGHGNLAVDGAFAEYVVVEAAAIAAIPDGVSFTTAAGSLCAGLTAYQALFRKANLNNVETVLIHAGAGGVGSMAIQFAKHMGKRVYTTVSAHKQDFVAQLAPDAQIDYRTADVTQRIAELTGGQGVDLIINTIGHPEADLPRLAYNGQLVCLLAVPESIPTAKAVTVSKLDLGGAHRSGNPQQVEDLGRMTRELLALIAAGTVDPLVSKVLPADQIPTGLQLLKDDQVAGKLVATFGAASKF